MEQKLRKYTITPKQSDFLNRYTDPASITYGNCYKSALEAGYKDQTARNLTHNNPNWLSETLGQACSINPEQITRYLTAVIYAHDEPTKIKLKAVELMMRHHNMMKQFEPDQKKVVVMQIDLSGKHTPVDS